MNGVEFLGVEFSFGGLYDTPRAGVEEYLRAVKIQPDAAGSRNLSADHKTGSGCPQEGDCICGTVLIFHVRLISS